MNYTSSEIEAAVTKLVRGTLRKPYGILGNRDLETAFNDLQNAAAGVFIQAPNAPFYLLYLSTLRIVELLTSETVLLGSLVESIQATARRSEPLNSTSHLKSARTALTALESAATNRNKIFSDIEAVPAFQRFVANTDRFLAEVSRNLVRDGSIVQTAEEAREALPGIVDELVEVHTELLRRVNLVANAIADYESLDLGQLVSSSVIQNARRVLDARLEELESLEPEERNQIVREVTLDMLASRAAVSGFGSLASLTTFLLLEGTGSVYSDTTHPATPASILSDVLGPYALYLDRELSITPDGLSSPLVVTIRQSFIAFLTGTTAEPFDITAATNDHLVIEMPGFSDVDVTLTAGVGRTAEQIVADINAAITTQPIIARAAFIPIKFSGEVDLDATGSTSDMDFVFNPPSAGDWTALPIEEGDLVSVLEGSQSGALYQVDIGGISASTLTCTQVSGPAPADESLVLVEAGDEDRFIEIDIDQAVEATVLNAINSRQIIRIAEATNSAANTLGFFHLQETKCQAVTAQAVSQDINDSTAIQVNGIPRVRAEAEFVGSLTLLGRTDPNDPLKIVLLNARARMDYTSGTSVTFTLVSTLVGSLVNVVVGNKVVIRTSTVQADIDVVGTVTSTGATSFVASFGSSVTASTNQIIEVGPDLTIQEDTTLRVFGGTANDGDYEVSEQGSIPIETIVTRPLTLFRALGGLPNDFELTVGHFAVRFYSTSDQVDSSIEVAGDAQTEFFAGDNDAIGTTPYLQLPEIPKGLELGDVVEVYDLYHTPSDSYQIVGIEESIKVIEVTPEVVTDPSTHEFSLSKVAPFARIRKRKKNNYDLYRTRLLSWLEKKENQVSYFRDLNRLINPLTSNRNPTASTVADAKRKVEDLLAILSIVQATVDSLDPEESLESILQSYKVETVPAADALLESFRQRGADRAVAVLLEGRFSEFFGLSQSGISYLGNVLELMREVQREDLPLSKVNRQAATQGIVLASYEEPDAEFDLSDTDEV